MCPAEQRAWQDYKCGAFGRARKAESKVLSCGSGSATTVLTMARIPGEPRWIAVVALIAVGWLYMGLPQWLSVGPRWALLLTVVVLLIPTVCFHRAGMMKLNRVFGLLL